MVSTETNAGLSPATLRAWLQFWWIRQASTNIDRRRLSMNLSCKCLHHINILWNVNDQQTCALWTRPKWFPASRHRSLHGKSRLWHQIFSTSYGYTLLQREEAVVKQAQLVNCEGLWTKMFFSCSPWFATLPAKKIRPSNSWQNPRHNKGWMTTILAKSIWSPNKPQRHQV